MPLVSVVQQLSFAKDLQAIQEIVRRAARALTGADGATFVLKDGDRCYYADEDALGPLWKGMRFPLQACISGWAMLHARAAVVADVYADPRIPAEVYRPTFVKSLVMVPIRSADPIGAIGNYWATPHEATPAEVQTLQALADATALAMENVRAREELERRVRERVGELQAARAADHAHLAQGRFLAAASHDLRQPLQSLALLTGTLRRMISDPEAQEALQAQESAVSAASQLVNAILDVTKLDSGAVKAQAEDFAIAGLLEDLRRELAPLAARKGLKMRLEAADARVRSDPLLLAQILRNLISNAIKYTREGAVTLRALPEAAGVRVEVSDTGVGIPAASLPHIFEEFYQVGGGAAARAEGYGLGLSIVARLVSLLDLKLAVSSEPGVGSVFSLRLPMGAPAVSPVREECAASPNRRQERSGRVLLVEDDRSVREATRLLLRSEGYEVLAAASAAEALQQGAALRATDLLITDYHLGPGESGLDVIAAIRRRLGPRFRAILLSGDTSPAITGLVPDEHMRLARKPIDADQLLALMSQVTAAAADPATP